MPEHSVSVVLSHNINQTILDIISESHSGLTSSIATLGWSLGGAAVLAVTRAQGQGTVVLMEFPGLQHLLDLVLMVGSYSLQADDEKGTAQETWCSVAFAVKESAWFQSQLLPVLQDHEAQVGHQPPAPVSSGWRG